MQHLNYCRQALEQFVSTKKEDIWQNFSSLCEENLAWAGYENKITNMEIIIKHLVADIKFKLPRNAKIIEDDRYKGIKSIGELRLPFDEFILEFEPEDIGESGTYFASKVIMVVTKRIEAVGGDAVFENDDQLAVLHIWFSPDLGRWLILPPMLIRATVGEGSLGGISLMVYDMLSEKLRTLYTNNFSFGDLARPLLEFLNAVSCRNVHIEKSPAKATKQGKKVKAALPFDDYHFLTVDVPGNAGARGEALGGSHRSPREHLRRGHIRRLESGPIWVNACVVNAGIGSKVGKSYLLRHSA